MDRSEEDYIRENEISSIEDDDDPRELLAEIYGAPPEDEQVSAIIRGTPDDQ